jgi:thymidine phosphorylase
MDQPLGDAVGNALDVAEAVEVLRGTHRGNLRELSVWFAALDDGSALERFGRMVAAQGGDPRVVEDPGAVLPHAPVIRPLVAPRDGIVTAIDAEDVGLAAGALGAGRVRKDEPIDPAVGIVIRPKIGDRVGAGQPIGEIHARTDESADEATRRTLAALTLGEGPASPLELVLGWREPAPSV